MCIYRYITPSLKAQESIQNRLHKDCKSQRWWMALRKHHFPETTKLIHVQTQRVCDSVHKTITDSNETKSQQEKRLK